MRYEAEEATVYKKESVLIPPTCTTACVYSRQEDHVLLIRCGRHGCQQLFALHVARQDRIAERGVVLSGWCMPNSTCIVRLNGEKLQTLC